MWFTEDAWSPIIVCIVAAVISLIAWSSTQRPKFLAVSLVILLAAGAVYFLEQLIVTPGEKAERALYDLIETFAEESRELSGANKAGPESLRSLTFFSPQNVEDRARVVAALLVVDIENDVRVTDVQIRLTNENTRAITHFRANATIKAGGFAGHHASRWELTWQQEAGEWKVTRTRMLNIMNGQEERIPRVD